MFHYADSNPSAQELRESARRPLGASASRATVADLIGRLWDTRAFMLVTALVCVIAALVFSAVAPASYEASAQVYVDPQDLNLLKNTINPALANGDSGAIFIESQARIMHSEAILRAVATRLDLTKDPEFTAKPGHLAQWLPSLAGPAATDPDAALRGVVISLADAVYVVRDNHTYLIEVSARSRDPQRAAAIANGVVAAYLELRERQRVEQARRGSAELEDRLEDLRASVQKAEEAVEQFKTRNNIVSTGSGVLIENRMNDVNTAVSAAERATGDARARLDQIRLMKRDPALLLASPEAANSPNLLRLRGDYKMAAANVATLEATLGPRHPSVTSARAQLDFVTGALNREIGRLIVGAELAYKRAVAQHDEAKADLSRLTGNFQHGDKARVELRYLEREAQSRRGVYEQALLRARETREQVQINPTNVQVISPATPPLRKRFPPGLSILLPLALILGAGAGAALGLAAGQLRRSGPNPLKRAASV